MTTKKPQKNSNPLQSISTAYKGLIGIIKKETAIKWIVFALFAGPTIAIFLKLSLVQIILIISSWLQVLIFEINNTAIEIDMDYTSDKEYHPMIKKVKDYAAATVFLSSSFAIVLSLTLYCLRLTHAI